MNSAARLLIAPLAGAFMLLLARPCNGAELIDPSPVHWAESYFEIGEIIADREREIVYIIDRTSNRLLAYDLDARQLTATATIDGSLVYTVPTLNLDGTELWLPARDPARVLRFQLPDLAMIDVLHISRPLRTVAEGVDGRIYGFTDRLLVQMDAVTGSTISETFGYTSDDPLIQSNAAGTTFYLLETGLSGGGDDVYEQITIAGNVPPPASIILEYEDSDGLNSDRHFWFDEAFGKLYRSDNGDGLGVAPLGGNAELRWGYIGDGGGRAVTLQRDGSTVYSASRTHINRFDRSDGTLLYDYEIRNHIPQPGEIMNGRLAMTPSGRVFFASDRHLGNGTGVGGRLYFFGTLGGGAFDMLPVATAPAAAAGENVTITTGETLTLSGTTSLAPPVADDPVEDLFGWWPLDETTGNTGASAIPTGRNAHVTGVTWGDGRHGGGATFSGTGGVDLSSQSGDMQEIYGGAVCAWFRTTSASEQVIFSTEDTVSDPVDAGRILFALRGGVPTCELWEEGDLEDTLVAQGRFDDGQWHHAALASNAQGTAIYIDGVKTSGTSTVFLNDVTPFDKVYFGRRHGGSGFDGSLDDLRIYRFGVFHGEIPSIASQPTTPAVTTHWEQVSGEGAATFTDASSPTSDVQFSTNGTYTLRQTASANGRSGSDLLQVRVEGEHVTLLDTPAPCRWLVPQSASDLSPGGTDWWRPEANASSWGQGQTGVGYEPFGNNFTDLIATDVETQMYRLRTSCLVRIPFDVARPERYADLTLRFKYNDGFVAYLNGVEVARDLAPDGNPAWDARSTESRFTSRSVVFTDFDLTDALHLLQPGENLFAVHGLSQRPFDGDFIIYPELVAEVRPAFPAFEAWLASHSLTGSAAGDDPDADGLTLFAEYSFGGHPTNTDPEPALIVEQGGTYEFRFPRRTDATARGLRYEVHTATTLEDWAAIGDAELPPLPGASGWETARFQIVDTQSAAQWRAAARLRDSTDTP